MEVITLVGRASGICLQPCLPGLSFCVCIGVILGLCGCALIWYWFRTVQLVCLCTIAVLMNVTTADGRGIPMTMLSHLEGGRFERPEWPLVVSQGTGLMAPPMSVLGHTVVSFRSDGELYIWSVFFWWNSLETSLMTGSLLFVAPVRRGIVLRLSQVSADFLLCAVDGVSRTAFGERWWPSWRLGTAGPAPTSTAGIFRVHVSWSSRGGGGGVTLGSAGQYDLDTKYIPDVLGLCARRLEAAVVKVMSRKDNQSFLVLIQDEIVGYQGFHDVLLPDMGDADAL